MIYVRVIKLATALTWLKRPWLLFCAAGDCAAALGLDRQATGMEVFYSISSNTKNQ